MSSKFSFEKIMTSPFNPCSIIFVGGRANVDAEIRLRRIRLTFATLALFIGGIFSGCGEESSGGLTREQWRKGAAALQQQGHAREAIDFYRAYLESAALAQEDVPKVLFQMGKLSQDVLKDCTGALPHYRLVQALYPDETFSGDLGKRLVACLEGSGRAEDAQAALGNLTRLPGATGQIGGTTDGQTPDNTEAYGEGARVARVEGRDITIGEVARAVGGRMPEAPLERSQAIRGYVAHLLMASSARRLGLAQVPVISAFLYLAETSILAQAALRKEMSASPPNESELKTFFEQNRSVYTDSTGQTPTFDSVIQRVAQDFERKRQSEVYVGYVDRLLKASDAQFFGAGAGASP
jgi:hypothetical protein